MYSSSSFFLSGLTANTNTEPTPMNLFISKP
jgi:hypothetical protein